MSALAQSLAESAAANVITPDLRGHGPSPDVRGDIDYIDQLEDDLADLIAHLRDRAARGGEIVVGGHSSGAGLALRFGGSVYGDRAAGYLLLAPYLGHDAPTTRSPSFNSSMNISQEQSDWFSFFSGSFSITGMFLQELMW